MLPLKSAMLGIGTPHSSENAQCFGGTYNIHFQGQSSLSAFFNFLIGLLFRPQNGRGMFLQSFGVSPNYMALQPRKLYSSTTHTHTHQKKPSILCIHFIFSGQEKHRKLKTHHKDDRMNLTTLQLLLYLLS
jgi:hypothetical protein